MAGGTTKAASVTWLDADARDQPVWTREVFRPTEILTHAIGHLVGEWDAYALWKYHAAGLRSMGRAERLRRNVTAAPGTIGIVAADWDDIPPFINVLPPSRDQAGQSFISNRPRAMPSPRRGCVLSKRS